LAEKREPGNPGLVKASHNKIKNQGKTKLKKFTGLMYLLCKLITIDE
jgi:hypothetical protein